MASERKSSDDGLLDNQELGTLTRAREAAAALAALGGEEGLARGLGVHLTVGVHATDVAARKQRYGENRLPVPPATSLWEHFVDSLDDRDLKILIVAAISSVLFGLLVTADKDDAIQGFAIMSAVVIVSTVSTIQNYRQEKGFQALTRVAADREVQVTRDGKPVAISVFDLVPGDLLTVTEGLVVPADGVLLHPSFSVRVDQSSLTGESDAVDKGPERPVLFFGTTVLEGEGTMLVTAVGEATPTGQQVADMMVKRDEKRRANTPMQDKLEEVAEQIGYLGMVVGALTFLVLTTLWLFVDGPLDPDGNFTDDTGATVAKSWTDLVTFFIVGVSIVVVAVPEGLPLSVTISLAYSVNKMMDDNNYVRTLSACETMGGATVICTDKTGTLTENRMTVVQGWFFDRSFHDLTNLATELSPELSHRLAQSVALNSSAGLNFDELDHNGKPKFRGNPTESAMLWCMREHLAADYEALRARSGDPLARRPFRKADKYMSTVRTGDNQFELHCKGAPEIVLAQCSFFRDSNGEVKPLTPAKRREILSEVKRMAKEGLRTIALTSREVTEDEAASQDTEEGGWGRFFKRGRPEQDMVIHAVFGIADPLRKEVPAAVRQCQTAGIRVVMVTGDHLVTATSIARKCGILPKEYQHPPTPTAGNASALTATPPHLGRMKGGLGDNRVIEGFDFRELVRQADDAAARAAEDDTYKGEADLVARELDALVSRICVLARSSPADKATLVRLMKARREVVGVTGDGTNDAPALLEADVGLAMGIAGTDVAKEAANIVILDDNFFSIVASVKWGRSIRENIRKFLLFQLTINVVALALTFVVACFNKGSTTKFPLTSVQLLWVNLIMDSFAALALATEPPTDSLLLRDPENRDSPMITPTMWKHMIGHAAMQAVVLLWLTLSPSGNAFFGVSENGSRLHYTMVFNTFVLLNVFNKLNCRKIHDELNVFADLTESTMAQVIMVVIIVGQVAMVQLGGDWCQTVPLTLAQWLQCAAVGSVSLLWGFLLRLVKRETQAHHGAQPPRSGKTVGGTGRAAGLTHLKTT